MHFFDPLKSRVVRAMGFNPLFWRRSVVSMDRWVTEFLSTYDPSVAEGPETLIVVSPWEGTYVPWHTLAVGLMMAAGGARVRFVLDDVPDGAGAFRHYVIMRSLNTVMGRVATRFDVLRLTDFDPHPLDRDDRLENERLAALNTTWELRGEMPQKGRQAIFRRKVGSTIRAHGHIKALLERTGKCDLLFMCGGVFGDSGLWVKESRERGMRIATFDTGGYETTMLAANGLACHLDDVPIAFRMLKDHWQNHTADRDGALERADAEIAKRREGVDVFSSQVSGATGGGGELDGGILIALNSSWDAAALGPHRAFPDNTSWIVETVRILLDKTDRPVIVRQHPAERLPIAATSEDYRLMLSREFGEHERLHFIAAQDPINSYALLEKVRAVVVHTSTIGMEAVAFGRPVVTGSASYYADLGFVEKALTLADYERALLRVAATNVPVSPEMKDDAKLCFYITQCCNWVFSTFNPADYPRWIEKPLSHWTAQPAVTRMIESLITGVPVAVLNHHGATAS
ncbi:MAG: hypothetical protein GW855_10275 [Erythrobacter sp.]|nr:hypothetical protein [Erythrobacter sp.]NCQ63598.1 hypothetical protein [Alphaproteobacteria bacterium]